MMRFAEETETRTADEQAGPSAYRNGQKISLWLVDDHAGFREVLAELLGQEPALKCARQFHSAEALLAAMTGKAAPDMVLTDYNMKGMSGAESVPRIKSIAPTTKVVVMTAFYDEAKKSAAMQAGADGFLWKSRDWNGNIEYLLGIAATREVVSPVAVAKSSEIQARKLPAHRTSHSSAAIAPTLFRALRLLRAIFARYS
jgi:two-component system nitrate/nitrite response regulator NarL